MSSKEHSLQRSLKSRHMSMIAIGGAIGTGLFLAVGGSLSQAGPGGALLAYGVIGIMVYFLMTSLGEMATHCPVSGSFEIYASRYVDPAMGFALGWNYWYNWAITVAAELAATGIVMKYFFPTVPGMVWSAIALALLLGLNILSTKGYGESEFWFVLIKVTAIIVFLVLGILMILGIIGGKAPGFDNWVIQDAPFAGGFLAILNIFMIAGFSFQGTEIVGVAAGESENPEKNVPKAIKTVFWRIMIFYIGAIVVMGFILPYTDPNLLAGAAAADADEIATSVAMSPFTLIYARAGLAGAAAIMNAVILTSILSCGNSGLYVASRMLYGLAKEGKAPKLFAHLNSRGVPDYALYITALIGCATFLSSLIGDGTAYIWLVNASGLAGFVTWVGIAIAHFRFRRAWVAQGKDVKDLKYRAKFFPFGPLFAFALCLIVIIGQNFDSLVHLRFGEMLVTYIGLVFVIVLYFVYKFRHKTKVVPLREVDLSEKLEH